MPFTIQRINYKYKGSFVKAVDVNPPVTKSTLEECINYAESKLQSQNILLEAIIKLNRVLLFYQAPFPLGPFTMAQVAAML